MSIENSRGRLADAFNEFYAMWNHSGGQWNDNRRDEFESTYIVPLATEVTSTLQAMEELSVLVRRARQECMEDEPR